MPIIREGNVNTHQSTLGDVTKTIYTDRVAAESCNTRTLRVSEGLETPSTALK